MWAPENLNIQDILIHQTVKIYEESKCLWADKEIVVHSNNRMPCMVQINYTHITWIHLCLLGFFWFLVALGFELQASYLLGRCSTAWVTLPALFYAGHFWDRVLETISPGWVWTAIFLISASWEPRITEMGPMPCRTWIHFSNIMNEKVIHRINTFLLN
jgi:hypothetical protein